MNHLTERLKKMRGSKSREEVSEAVGISVSALGMYEGGYRVPRDEIKLALAHYYNTTVGFLFFGEKTHE